MVSSFHRGHKTITGKDLRWRYADTERLVPINPSKERPCKLCGKKPTRGGDDWCLGHLPGVLFACCGHGVEEGYILFENGIRISGKFTVERFNKRRK